MVGLMMTCHSKIRNFLVGIDYDDFVEDRGHLTLRRKVSLGELVEEIKEIMTIGSHYPQFPPEAFPTVTYAYDLNDQEDSDCYHEIMNELEKYNRKEVIY